MSRRGKLEMLGLFERAFEMHEKEKLTIKQIIDIFREEGWDVTYSSVQRGIVSAKNAAKEINARSEEARVLLEAYRNNPGTDIQEAVVKYVSSNLLGAALSLGSFETDDPLELVKMVDKLASAQIKISQHTLKYTTGFEEAKKAVLTSLKDELKNHPDILERLSSIVQSLEPAKK
ncbi:MAG: DUF3486 family protein [Spirochaetaceae bacterium]|jgi:hypothetical protein|nr:DUF3486 family protein [Spirochaetaceae bacterium]